MVDKLDRIIRMPAAGLGLNSLTELLQKAFQRAGEIADTDNLESPLRLDLVTADNRSVLTMTMVREQERWRGHTESGEFDSREGMPLPWCLILEDVVGRVITIRLELDQLTWTN